jgi:hypothetical protein
MPSPDHEAPFPGSLGEAIRAYKRDNPEPRDADSATVLKQLEKMGALVFTDTAPNNARAGAQAAVAAFANIAHLFKPDDGSTGSEDGPLASPTITLIDVLVRAERHRRKVAARELYERAAQKKIIAAGNALDTIGEFVAMIAKEAEDAEKSDWRDYDLEPDSSQMDWGEGLRLEAARQVIYENIERRWELGEERLKRYHTTNKKEQQSKSQRQKDTKPPLHYSILAGLRDLVLSLDTCVSPKASQQDIARLAGVIFDAKISDHQVKDARRWMRRTGRQP